MYISSELFKEIMAMIEDKTVRPCFLYDVADLVGIAQQTIYDHFPLGSEEMEAIKKGLRRNRAQIRIGLRQDFYNNGSSAEKIMLYKTVVDEEERQRISMNYIAPAQQTGIDYSALDDDDIKELARIKAKVEQKKIQG